MTMEATTNSKVKKSAKRNTEARREQNRLASRNYREKRKQKLALLNEILDGSNGQQDQDPPAGGQNLSVTNGSFPATSVSGEGPVDAISAPNQEVSFGNVWGDLPDNSTVNFGPTPFLDRIATPEISSSQGLALDSFLAWDPVMSTETLFGGFIRSPERAQTPQEPTMPNNTFFDVLKGVDSLSFHQKRALLRHLQKQTRDDATASPLQSQLATSDQISADALKTMQQTLLQIEAQQFARALHRTASGIGPSPAPSQYVLQAGFFGALMANCYAIGMGSVDALLMEDSWSVFSLAPEMGYHPSQLQVARAKFQDMTPDLRPVDMQLTFAHHPYLDVIPFKSFRENALKALDQHPPLLDEDELCRDLLAGGLLCWGAQQKALSLDAAVPWDARSWEPKIWFLRKYKHLVGGWNDEMWKGARWWHGIRGERVQEVT